LLKPKQALGSKMPESSAGVVSEKKKKKMLPQNADCGVWKKD